MYRVPLGQAAWASVTTSGDRPIAPKPRTSIGSAMRRRTRGNPAHGERCLVVTVIRILSPCAARGPARHLDDLCSMVHPNGRRSYGSRKRQGDLSEDRPGRLDERIADIAIEELEVLVEE